MKNMRLAGFSVDRSLGARIGQQIQSLPPRTMINKVTIGDL